MIFLIGFTISTFGIEKVYVVFYFRSIDSTPHVNLPRNGVRNEGDSTLFEQLNRRFTSFDEGIDFLRFSVSVKAMMAILFFTGDWMEEAE